MAYHVFIKQGDAQSEIDALLKELRVTAETAGLHKYIYVARANQTVVMLNSGEAPLAVALRRRAGWQEPEVGAGN